MPFQIIRVLVDGLSHPDPIAGVIPIDGSVVLYENVEHVFQVDDGVSHNINVLLDGLNQASHPSRIVGSDPYTTAENGTH
jgi:hypothetical protein